MHMLLILLTLCLRKLSGVSHLFSIAYAFIGVNIRLTRFNQVGRLYGAIIAAPVIRSCALAKRDVGPTSSSKRSSPHSCRLTGVRPRSLLSEMRSSNPWSERLGGI